MSDLGKAQELILQSTPVLGSESVPILTALGRVLARDVRAGEDFPASNISAIDGYALGHQSLCGGSDQSPVRLEIIGESPAGRPCQAIVQEGQAIRIMTGGLVPQGADTVVGMENTTEDNGYVLCTAAPGPGKGIRHQGQHFQKGQLVLSTGEVVTPLAVGALATLRRAHVYVHRKPIVAILSTGDELTDFHEPPSPCKTMCSSLYALTAQVMASGATPLCLGIVEDDLAVQRARLSEALQADVIITSGGMSQGKYDLVGQALKSLKLQLKYSTIFQKPKKPTIFGLIGPTLVFGLPGNPTATMLSFEQFIKPALFKMMGHRKSPRAVAKSLLTRPLNSPLADMDSFGSGQAKAKDHPKGSLVPLEKVIPEKNRQCHNEKATSGPNENMATFASGQCILIPKTAAK